MRVGGITLPITNMSSEEDEDVKAGGEDPTLPKVVLKKMIKEQLPDNTRVSNDARKLVNQCAMEFIKLLTSEANEITEKQSKKIISPDHVFSALENLGFGNFLHHREMVMSDYKNAVAKKRRYSNRLEHQGVPIQELLKQQQDLFAKAREEQLQRGREVSPLTSQCNSSKQIPLHSSQDLQLTYVNPEHAFP